MSLGRLLVIVPDRVSDWIDKGEVVDRYFNPQNVFSEVHLLLTNDDRPELDALQRMAGSATIQVHNLPAALPLFLRTLGWRPRLLRGWAQQAVDIAQRIEPSLVRCHGVRLNAFAAAAIREAVGVPYVVSIHSNPDLDQLRGSPWTSPKRLAGSAAGSIERIALQHAALVLPVYSPIVPYLQRMGIEHYEVVYNVVGHRAVPKTSYAVDSRRLRALCVGRQQAGEKDPRPIIDAVAGLDDVELHLIGDGDLHAEVAAHAARTAAGERIRLTRALPNEQVLAEMASSDVFVYRSSIYEVSKGCIEAALTGLPVVVNDRQGDPAPELTTGDVWLVDGSTASYHGVLARLAADEGLRERYGRAARRLAEDLWEPTRQEAKLADIYRRLSLPC